MSASGDPDPEVDKPVITTVREETSQVKGAQPQPLQSPGGRPSTQESLQGLVFWTSRFGHLVTVRVRGAPGVLFSFDFQGRFMRPYSLVAKCLAI